MKKLSFLLILISSFVISNAQSTIAHYICSTDSCGTAGSDIISAAPTDGTTFYCVWYVSSASTITGADQVPQPSATSGTANMGSTTITNTSGSTWRISTSATINVYQNKPTVSNIDLSLSFVTAASFPAPALTGSASFNTTTPLPVDFLNVNAISLSGFNQIEWSTASELNNDYFTIERSLDGTNWEEVGIVEGAGTSSTILDYQFKDYRSANALKTFYQIAQYDYDGNVTRTDIVTATRSTGDVVIYPNPATTDIVSINEDLDVYTVEVRNLTGQLVNAKFNFDANTLDVSKLVPGLYFISVNDTVVKLVK